MSVASVPIVTDATPLGRELLWRRRLAETRARDSRELSVIFRLMKRGYYYCPPLGRIRELHRAIDAIDQQIGKSDAEIRALARAEAAL